MRGLASMAAIALLAPGAVRAGPSLSLNGVPIDGAVSQRIENATVVIDERGNVNILAQGYAVERRAEEPPAASAEKLLRRYFVVATPGEPGPSAWDVAVFLNGRWVHEVRGDAEAAPFEVTRFLRPGPNRVQLVATRRGEGERHAPLKLVIGEGHLDAGGVLVDAPLVEMVRGAAEADTVTEERTLVAR